MKNKRKCAKPNCDGDRHDDCQHCFACCRIHDYMPQVKFQEKDTFIDNATEISVSEVPKKSKNIVKIIQIWLQNWLHNWKYRKAFRHFDNCPIYKKHNKCACLIIEAEGSGKKRHIEIFDHTCIRCGKSTDKYFCSERCENIDGADFVSKLPIAEVTKCNCGEDSTCLWEPCCYCSGLKPCEGCQTMEDFV